MPKISASTVAEHRANQRAALVRAGEGILQEAGLAGVSPRTVCERAGLARSSFYDYFATKDDLLVAIAIDAIERWDAEIEEALQSVDAGLPTLRAFVDATMAMTAEGKHTIASVLRQAELSPTRFEDLMALHDALLRPVLRVLADVGAPEPKTWAAFVEGVLGTGIRLVTLGMDHRATADKIYQLLTRGLPG